MAGMLHAWLRSGGLAVRLAVLLAGLVPAALAAAGLGPFPVVGIMTATGPELEPLLEGFTETGVTELAGRTFRRGNLAGQAVVLVEGGVGKVNAALTATLLATRFEARLVLFSGVAGGLAPDLGLGDVVISARTVQADYVRISERRATPRPIKRLDHDGRHKEAYLAPPGALLEQVRTSLTGLALDRPLAVGGRATIRMGTVCTADAFVLDPGHRRWLIATFGGTCHEMEGAAVAQVARSMGVPWLIVRGISDHTSPASSLVYPLVRKAAAGNAALAIKAVLEGLAR